MLELGSETNDALKFLAEDSGNVDESGNFSLQVLSKGVERSHGVTLSNANSELHRGDSDVIASHDAFVLNRSAHWFTIRKLYGRFWDLNSMLDHPQVISDFYLSSMLAQFRNDGYDVFVASGQLPDVNLDIGYGMGQHFKVSDLVNKASSKAVSNVVVDPWAALGSGQVLNGSGQEEGNGNSGGSKKRTAFDDEEDDLAAAIAMSLTENNNPSSSSSSSSPTSASTSASSAPTTTRVLPSEPLNDEPSARIMVRGGSLTSGKIVRKFRENDEASYLFDWVDANLKEQGVMSSQGDYELVQMRSVFSRAALTESHETFKEAGLAPSSALMIKRV